MCQCRTCVCTSLFDYTRCIFIFIIEFQSCISIQKLVVGAVSLNFGPHADRIIRAGVRAGMDVTASLQGECGYCGGRVEEAGGEGWLPLQCSSCQQLFHVGCLRVPTVRHCGM